MQWHAGGGEPGGGDEVACATKGSWSAKQEKEKEDERRTVWSGESAHCRREVDIRCWCATSNRCPSNNVQPTSLAASRFSLFPPPSPPFPPARALALARALSSSSFTFFRRARHARDSSIIDSLTRQDVYSCRIRARDTSCGERESERFQGVCYSSFHAR